MFREWLDRLPYEVTPDCDARILGSRYHRITLENWVMGALTTKDGGFMIHPFLGLRARKWMEMEKQIPAIGALMDQPGWVSPEILGHCRVEFAPTLSVFRFHLGNGEDRVVFTGPADGRAFTSLPLNSESEWRGFIADASTIYGAVRRASGAHFDADQRTCHHGACPHYESNFCNVYPVIPTDFKACGFPARIQNLIEVIGGS
jgi:hypothetical protein